jgi:hypothetical protein
MEQYLPFVKALLSEWYLLTLSNPLYAATLASAVWLLTAVLYSLRISSLKRGKVASEKAGRESLNDLQQQLQRSQEELAEATAQMEKAHCAVQDETQRALSLEQLIYQRNQQIAGIIQSLATSFDLGERPLLATEDVKADALWQQHDKVINQLTDRLRTELKTKIELQQTCQAETAKLAEKEALLEVLQTTLAAHTNQLSRLEQALEEQKLILQQQDNAQQVLSNTLKNFQPVVMRPAEPIPEPEVVKPANTWQQPVQLAESPAVEEPVIVQPVQENRFAHFNDEPQAPVSIQQEAAPIEIEPTAEIEAVAPVQPDIIPQVTVEEAPVSINIEPQPVNPPKGSLGKIKNLFGKKQQPVKTEPQWTAASDTPQSDDDAKNGPGKLKGFYSKFRSKDK